MCSNTNKSPVLTLCHPTTWPFVLVGIACHGDGSRKEGRFLPGKTGRERSWGIKGF